MSARVAATPSTAKPGQLVGIDAWCLDLGTKYELVTIDSAGTLAGFGSNGTRPGPDGALYRGILAPPRLGNAKVQVRKANKTVVAECPLVVKL